MPEIRKKYSFALENCQIANALEIDYFIRMDLRTLRLYHLAKQNLLIGAPARNYRRVLKDYLGLHPTDSLTPYLSLRARVEEFINDKLRPCGA